MMIMRDYYRDMDLAVNATNDEIKGQYRRLAKEFHPDRNSSPYAEQRFKQVTEAYAVLSDPQKRSQYDFERRNHYNQRQSTHTQTQSRKQTREEAFSDFFNSPLWGAVKGFAGNVAQDFVQGLDHELQEEYDVDPFVERVTTLTTRHNNSGSISITCSISHD